MGILKAIALIIVFCLSTILFLPKQSLYFALEKELKQYEVVISDEKFTPLMFGFKLENASLYLKGVNIASLDIVSLSLDGLTASSKEIGSANTKIDMTNKSLIVNFKPTKFFVGQYKTVLKYFKKQNDGVYKYEYKLF